jgi:hypothetical protein
MSTTLGNVVDSTLLYLSGFTNQQDQSTYLLGGLNTTDLTASINDASGISRGVVEIGYEIIQVDNVDRASQAMTIPPYGRGFRCTDAATHSAGTRVVSSPQFPRFSVRQAVNDSISAVYPDLFAITDEFLTADPTKVNFTLTNTNARHVLRVAGKQVGPSLEFVPIRKYELRPYTSGGPSLSLYEQPVPGQQIHVRTAGPPQPLSADTDLFSATGLPDSAIDVVRLGAAYRMVPYLETPLVSGLSATADLAANMRPIGAGERLGKYLLGLYRTRLEEVRRQQQAENPIRAHYER